MGVEDGEGDKNRDKKMEKIFGSWGKTSKLLLKK